MLEPDLQDTLVKLLVMQGGGGCPRLYILNEPRNPLAA
mgnify:CR=1 FL=1